MKKWFFTIALLMATLAHAQDVIQMEKKGGVYKVPCKINGLALKFVFDTGASDVSISLTEALFMYKNDYLKESDFRGTEYYRIANGDIAEGTKVVLRTVEIGKQKFYNVEASVVHSLEAPLLFGQSALQRFGKFTVDYSNNTLIIGGSNTTTTTAKPTTLTTHSTVTDIDGNIYKTVKIGNQVWMGENLKTTRYANGDVIPNVKDNLEWNKLTSEAWCYYNNDSKNNYVDGKLYNGHTIINSRNICPIGWFVPTNEDWDILVSYLGGEEVAGMKMKSVNGWKDNGNGINRSGFEGGSGGLRYFYGHFDGLGSSGCWWSSTEVNNSSVWSRSINYKIGIVGKIDFGKTFGFSVRCIKK